VGVFDAYVILNEVKNLGVDVSFLVEIEGREEYNNTVFGNARTWRSSFGSDLRVQPFLLDFNTIA